MTDQRKTQPSAQDMASIVRKEISLFSGSGNRGLYTQHAYNFLLTVPPASIELERAFSSAGSKLRSRMSDHVLDNVIFA